MEAGMSKIILFVILIIVFNVANEYVWVKALSKQYPVYFTVIMAAVTIAVLFFVWSDLLGKYKSIWFLKIIITPVMMIGMYAGTYLASKEVPTVSMAIALLLNIIAAIVVSVRA